MRAKRDILPDTMDDNDRTRDFKAVRKAATKLSLLTDDVRSAMLLDMARAFELNSSRIIKANVEDMEAAAHSGVPDALLHRLKLDEAKLAGAIEGVKAVAGLPCPVGRVKERRLLDEGLVLEKVSYPIGVIGMIFEARPDALIQIVSLAIKSANGIILKGGREAHRTNAALVEVIRENLDGAPFLMLLSSHEDVDAMLKMEGDVDLIIPRGSNAFVRHVMDNTHIPVMGHADGICSIYVDRSADIDLAVKVIVDSKVQYPAACNAVETVLVHEAVAARLLPRLKSSLDAYGVMIHADDRSRALMADDALVTSAVEDDFHTEYLSLQMALKVVDSLDEAIEHIAAHGSHHTDAIITSDDLARRRFFDEVDSADVFCNCSTRFADGFRFGLGAEVGISTSKMHARGPVGLDGLTTTKWLLEGHGQIVADYSGRDARRFIHEDLPL